MPVFSYVAKDTLGKYHRGDIETVDERQAVILLRRKNLIIVALKLRHDSGAAFWDAIVNRISFTDVVVLTRQLATMVEAGLILSEALDILLEQQTNKRFKLVLENISTNVKGGLDFASALEQHPDVFPRLYCKLVKAGETSGKLDKVLLELAVNLEKEREFKGKVKGAMIYPAVIICLMVAVMMIMMFFVMPKLMGMYKDSGMALPLPTQIVVGISNIILSYWWIFLAVSVPLVITIRHYLTSPLGRELVDRLILKIPVVGRIAQLVIMTNFTRTFGLLISSGVTILESIRIAGEVAGNAVFRQGLENTYRGVERGLSFSSQLLGLTIFPRIVGQMIRTGEETGKMDEVLTKISHIFEVESDEEVKGLTAAI